MDEEESIGGYYLDDLNSLRILPLSISAPTVELTTECDYFIEGIDDLKNIADVVASMLQRLSEITESEKMKAIASRNWIKSMKKTRDAKLQQMRSLIHENTLQLERLIVENESLKKEFHLSAILLETQHLQT